MEETFKIDNLQKIEKFLEKLILDLKQDLSVNHPNIVPHHKIINAFYNFRVTPQSFPYSYFTLKLYNDGELRFRVNRYGQGSFWEKDLNFETNDPERAVIDCFPQIIHMLENYYWEPKRRIVLKPMNIVINRMRIFWEENKWKI